MRAKKLSRREFLRLSALTAASVVIASCTKDVEEPVEPVEPDVPEEAEPQEPAETSGYKEAPALAAMAPPIAPLMWSYPGDRSVTSGPKT